MAIPLFTVDAFTSQPFRGNPAAVCLLDETKHDEWMQRVAAEMNLSETAFVRRLKAAHYNLRWFTPTIEVDLCGHATLASAHVLYEEGLVLRNEPIVFDTRSGTLTAKPSELGIQLDFPQRPVQPVPAPAQLEEALGTGWRFVGQSADDLLVELDSEAAVRSLRPQFDLLGRIPNARGVIVTSDCEADEFDFVSRFFAPAAGIAEDPVTGSAHCSLGPFWGERLHKDVMVGYQASPRGGVVHVSLKSGRALLAGAAVTVTHGELLAT